MSESTTETRGFRMHPKLLFDVIQRQAGTLGKAVLEGVMNSVDAKATECHVKLTRDGVEISDNGQGFRNRQEIENWFEVFGQPHEDSEQKVYGNFRMGRGQLFAFGKNEWWSNVFHMDVDIKNKGLDYDLTENGQVREGCTVSVDLYDQLSRTDQDSIEREIRMYCKYAPIPVYLNEELISVDPETEKWDYETEDAYIRIKNSGGLAVYHLGVYIMEYGAYRFGVGGTIVAKKQLKLNFARNDVLVSKCSVWRRIEKHFRETADDVIRKKPMNESARERMSIQMMNGELSRDDIMNRKLITAVTGRQYSLSDLAPHNIKYKYGGRVAVAPKGDMWGDRAMKQGLAFVVATVTLERFGIMDLKKLWARLKEIRLENSDQDWDWSVCDMDDIYADRDASWTPLETKELKPREKMWIRVLDGMSYTINQHIERSKADRRWTEWAKTRRVGIGISPCALAWTDGQSYVFFERNYLADLDFNLAGLMEVAHTMLHEYCHSTPDSESHTHSQEFYEKYHDFQEASHDAVMYAFGSLEKWLLAEDKKLSKKLVKERDKYEGVLRQREVFRLAEDAIYEGVPELTEPDPEPEPFSLI